MVQVVVCDFDGVIVDSNRLKHEAFFRLFPAEVAPIVDEVLAAAREQSRYEIIGRILTRAGGSADPGTVASLAELYDRDVTAGVRAIGLPPGVRETLADLATRYQLYLNSSTPEDSLRRTVDDLGIGELFLDERGGPASKLDNLSSILAAAEAVGEEVVVVGDGESDLTAARACGCLFVGIRNDYNRWLPGDFPLIADLTDLPALLPQLPP
jgi:phosphoglycolate phosphatase-like HAD superfamily hydrolase